MGTSLSSGWAARVAMKSFWLFSGVQTIMVIPEKCTTFLVKTQNKTPRRGVTGGLTS